MDKKIDKNSILKQLAENGYNVGFGAKKHFATFDIIEKVPNAISLIVLLVGVGQLAYPNNHYNTGISTTLIMVSILALTISSFNSEKEKYEKAGIELTKLFNELRALYYHVKNSNHEDFQVEFQQMNDVLNRYYSLSMSKQIFTSDWYAHYKFFFQMQIEWINEQKKFSFWKDKIPKSFVIFLLFVILVVWCWIKIFKG
ncbi:SLATT domain-containing protein [Metabacillus bambusae]|uniref:SLATT domain-containing protein n=1 Tax=Metabacillus bambusae TaxID=2795218 RepID=A0ABS3N5M1_9BACI|nr:SLATT domain-containing protein [Metabacillus bambusae]MBO1513514.1 SLATT domain-containing protein [Metabacillus bambusae]